MPFAVTDDLHIYYELSTPDDANAPRLLFIGGTGGDLRVKPNVMSGPLAKAFHLLAYDQRGLGQTFGHEGPFTMEQYADDAAAVMNHAGWDKAHVYGVSFGGMVAQNFVIRHPGLVDKLALACTSAGGASASFPLHTIHDLEGRERFEFMLGISTIKFRHFSTVKLRFRQSLFIPETNPHFSLALRIAIPCSAIGPFIITLSPGSKFFVIKYHSSSGLVWNS